MGEMGFRILFLVLLLLVGGTRGYYQRKFRVSYFKVSEEATAREGRAVVWIRLALFPVFYGYVALFILDPVWMAWSHAPVPDGSRWVGAMLCALCLPFEIWVHRTLGANWSTSVEVGHKPTLITAGPYRWMRHPMYAVAFPFFGGGMLLASDWIMIGLSVLGMVIIIARIPKEDGMLLEEFGEPYRAYMKRTGAFFPRRFPRGQDQP
jgi:protein-S-isoprenylcysteine O-methyltransferase Ste14